MSQAIGALQFNAEIAVFNRVKADLDKARSTMTGDAFMSYWEKCNDELRDLVGGVAPSCRTALCFRYCAGCDIL